MAGLIFQLSRSATRWEEGKRRPGRADYGAVRLVVRDEDLVGCYATEGHARDQFRKHTKQLEDDPYARLFISTPGTDSSNIHEPRWRTLASLRKLSSEAGKPTPKVAVIPPTSTERTRGWLESDTVGLVLPFGFLVAGYHRPDIHAY